jgi:hypothetical protein
VSRVDAYDLAKVLQALGEGDARQKILARCRRAAAKRSNTNSRTWQRSTKSQAQRLGAELIAQVKSAMLQKAA